MENNCPKCGYKCSEDAIYCAKCGYKLDGSLNKILEDGAHDKLPNINFVQDMFRRFAADKDIKILTSSKTQEEKTDNAYMTIILAFILISGLMFLGTNFALSKQSAEKFKLQYQNMVANPQLIPELKTPLNYKELIKNLREVQSFLVLYLKYSQDSFEIKEQIFTAYLKELSKLAYLSSDLTMLNEYPECSDLNKGKISNSCVSKINKEFEKVGIIAFSDKNSIYLFPDNEFLKEQFYNFVTSEMKQFLDLKAKYNSPVAIGLKLHMEPKVLINKIIDYEDLLSKTSNPYLSENLERVLYEDMYRLLFNSSIYTTATKEMAPKFKNAYQYFARTKKKSQFYPLILSYLDKKRGYTEENFKKDYPYKVFEYSFQNNVENSSFSDIFAQLRKNVFANSSLNEFKYVYDLTNAQFREYTQETKLESNELVVTGLNDNNIVSIYNNLFSLKQELSIPKFGELFLHSKGLYVYNKDRLTISKVRYNGHQFVTVQMGSGDVESLFPGIEVINLDSYPSYNILIEKPNAVGNFIILAKYSKGYSGYMLSSKKGEINILKLPNMFSVLSSKKTIISFHDSARDPDSTSEGKPTYKLVVQTSGYSTIDYEEQQVPQYDEQTAKQEGSSGSNEELSPNIMPKVTLEKYEIEDVELEENVKSIAPSQKIEPPKDED